MSRKSFGAGDGHSFFYFLLFFFSLVHIWGATTKTRAMAWEIPLSLVVFGVFYFCYSF